MPDVPHWPFAELGEPGDDGEPADGGDTGALPPLDEPSATLDDTGTAVMRKWSLQPHELEPNSAWQTAGDASTTGPPALSSTLQPGPKSVTPATTHLLGVSWRQICT